MSGFWSRRNRVRFAVCLAVLAGAFVMLRWFEHSQVYHPMRAMAATGAELGRPFENVLLETSDGCQLNGWFFPLQGLSPGTNRVVLVCHGNAGNISHRLELCRALLDAGLSVLVFDYRGYGQSTGRPSEEGTYTDAQAAYHWLRSKGFAADRILVYGESLGGGVASELALREPIAGLILTSTFTSIPDLGAELFPWLPVRLLGRIKYDTVRKLPRLTVPLLLLHSRTDGLVDFHHAERNFAAAREPKLLCELTGGHNDMVWNDEAFRTGLGRFLRLLDGRQAGGTAPPR